MIVAEQVYAMTARTAGRVQQLIGETDGEKAEPGRRVKPRVTTIVRCESATPAGAFGPARICYSARVILDAGEDSTPAQGELGRVWLTLWDDNDVPAVPKAGRLYVVVLSGNIDIAGDGRQRAFGVATCCDEDLTNYSGWSGSGWSGASGVSGVGTGLAVTYKDDCVSGVLKRYLSTIQFKAGRLVQSDWAFDRNIGCCSCGGSTSGGSTGSGSGGSTGSAGSTGSTGSGGGGGGWATTCCPDRNLPSQLWATIANVSGCSCLAGSYPLDHVTAPSPTWRYTGTTCGGKSLSITLACASGTTWSLAISCGAGDLPGGSGAAESCNPLEITFSGLTFGDCCSGSANVIISE